MFRYVAPAQGACGVVQVVDGEAREVASGPAHNGDGGGDRRVAGLEYWCSRSARLGSSNAAERLSMIIASGSSSTRTRDSSRAFCSAMSLSKTS